VVGDQNLIARAQGEGIEHRLDADRGVLDQRNRLAGDADEFADLASNRPQRGRDVLGNDVGVDELVGLALHLAADAVLLLLHGDRAGAKRAVVEEDPVLAQGPQAARRPPELNAHPHAAEVAGCGRAVYSPPMFDLAGFIAACLEVGETRHGPAQILGLVREAVRNPEALKAALPAQTRGTSLLDAPLHRSPSLTVLNVALEPGAITVPHDHSMWAVIGIYEGRENNTFYRRSGERLAESNHRDIAAGEAILLGPEVIHAIRNPLEGLTLGLHVYGGDLFGRPRSMWSPAGAEAAYETPGFMAWNKELARATRASKSPSS